MNPLSHKTIRKTISKEELNSLPLWAYSGKINLIRDLRSARQAVNDLLYAPLLGFDTETRPSFRKGEHYDPSLVQIANYDEVFLFQLPLIGGIEALIPLFESPLVLKACVGVHEDIRRLKAIQLFDAQGFVDIAEVTRKIGIEDGSLRKLAGILLGFRVSKREQTSNWGRLELSESQLRYGATDAWVSRMLYEMAQSLLMQNVKASD